MGDWSNYAMVSSREISRPRRDRFQTVVFCVCHAHWKEAMFCSALCSRWCRRIRAVEMGCKKPSVFQPCIECNVWNNYFRLILSVISRCCCFFLLIQWTAFSCLWERDRMLHWIEPVPRKQSTCLQNRSCICNAPRLYRFGTSTNRGFKFGQSLRSGCLIHNGTYLMLSLTLTITLTLQTLTVTVRITLTLLTLLLDTVVNKAPTSQG